ncbi:MAG: XTP/dITP diphosphatase [Erysipelotrichaceae bacterium]|nr:XTP/dITP diphosphatase [Erysipelotrichaceae bacterium]
MKELMIATSNAHKVEEFKKMLEPRGIVVKSLLDLDEKIEIEENGATFEENALIKAKSICDVLHMPVISDDSGLVIDAMNGAPGVHSARFLGYDTDYKTKNTIILSRMEDVTGEARSARFVCAIGLVYPDGRQMTFTGTIEGYIHDRIEGENGFGYDPIFYYPPFKTTTANVSEEMKNSVSHRGNALKKLMEYLNHEES